MKYSDVELFVKGQYRCVRTDSDKLNEVLGGGLRTDNLIVIQGPSGIGKTTFLLRLTYNCLLAGEKVKYISGGEQDVRELYERLGCLMCAYDYSKFVEEYNDEAVKDVKAALSRYENLLDIVYSDDPFKAKAGGTNDMSEFLDDAVKNDYKYVIYDYLGSAMAESSDSQYAFLASAAAALKNLATEYHMCIITAMQTNRAFKAALKEKNLDYTTLDETFMADSIGPARKASVCITLCRESDDVEYPTTHIVVWKNRLNGKLCDIRIAIARCTYKWMKAPDKPIVNVENENIVKKPFPFKIS